MNVIQSWAIIILTLLLVAVFGYGISAVIEEEIERRAWRQFEREFRREVEHSDDAR